MPTINKVIVDGEEIINLDNDTLSSASQIASGITAHLNTGEQVVGTGTLALYDYPIGGSYCDYVTSGHTGTCTGFHISETATQIRPYAFYQRKNLQSVYVPTSVISVGDRAFDICTSLTSIDVSNAASIGVSAFGHCTSLTSIDVSNATTIGEYAFSRCSGLTSVSLPQAISIGDFAFSNCTGLTSISLPQATSIGNYAFNGCTGLTGELSLPQATSISSYAFDSCTGLTSIDVSNAASIGDYAFDSCSRLTSVSLPQATSIGYSAFYDCTNLTSITIKNGVNIAPGSTICKIATLNNHLYWQKGTTSNEIYISDATAGSPTKTLIGTLTSSNPSFTYTDGSYQITFARTGSGDKFSISW